MLSLLSILLGLVDKVFGYAGQVDQDKTSIAVAQIAEEQTEVTAMSAVEQKWSFVAWLIPIFALPYAVWTWKAVFWDKIIEGGHTATDPLNGSLGAAYWIIISGIFLHAISKK